MKISIKAGGRLIFQHIFHIYYSVKLIFLSSIFFLLVLNYFVRDFFLLIHNVYVVLFRSSTLLANICVTSSRLNLSHPATEGRRAHHYFTFMLGLHGHLFRYKTLRMALGHFMDI